MPRKHPPDRRNVTSEWHSPAEGLPFLWRLPQNFETEPAKLEIALRERIKELNCLYGIAKIAERHGDSIDEVLRGLVN